MPRRAALYARAGFTIAGRRPRYYPGGGDALLLRAGSQPLRISRVVMPSGAVARSST